MDLKEAYKACREMVAAGDEDRYLAALLAPQPQQDHLMALYAFNLELAKIRHLISEPMLGEIRLQWWREVLNQVYSQSAVRKHEVALALGETIKKTELAREEFDKILTARQAEFYEAPFSGDLDQAQYFDFIEGSLVRIAASIMGSDPSDSLIDRASHWGTANAKFRARLGDPFYKKFDLSEETSLKSVRFAPVLAPAVLHLSLARTYLKKAKPTQFGKRLRMLWANLTGRL